jgi:hypothetical protein
MIKTFIKSRWVTIILSIFIAYMLYQNLRILYYSINWSLKINITNRLLLNEENMQKELNENLELTKTRYNIENKARNILGLIKKDEVAYKIVYKKGE